jgi:urea ABC transporter permease protein UrtC
VGGVYFALITQASALCFATLLISQQPLTGGFNGLTDFQTFFGFDLAAAGTIRALNWFTWLLVVAAFTSVRWLLASRFGKLLRATRDGENRIRFLGYDPAPYKVVAFTVSAILAGIAGALFTLHSGVISPALVGVVPSIEMVIWVAIGGRQSLWGAIAGTLLVNFARDKISSEFPDFWLYALGLSLCSCRDILAERHCRIDVRRMDAVKPSEAACDTARSVSAETGRLNDASQLSHFGRAAAAFGGRWCHRGFRRVQGAECVQSNP